MCEEPGSIIEAGSQTPGREKLSGHSYDERDDAYNGNDNVDNYIALVSGMELVRRVAVVDCPPHEEPVVIVFSVVHVGDDTTSEVGWQV